MRYPGILVALALCLGVAIAQAGGAQQADPSDGDTPEARAATAPPAAAAPDLPVQGAWDAAQVHLAAGRPRAAMPYLERLVSDAPDEPRYRLELARALFLIQDDTRARFHFDRALGGAMSFADLHAVHEYLAAMDRRRAWEGYFSAALVPQSNAWRRSGADSVLIAGAFDLPLERVRRATGLELEAGGTWLPALDRDLRARLHASLRAQVFDDPGLRSYRLRVEAGLLALSDRSRQIGGGVTGRLHLADGGRVLEGVGLYASWQERIGDAMLMTLRGDFERLRYPDAPLMDGPRVQIAGTLRHAASPRLNLTLGAELAHQRSRALFQRHAQGALSLGVEYAFDGGLVGAGTVSLGQTHYAAAHPFLPDFGAREDTRLDLSGRVMHRDFSFGGFAPVLELGYERVGSTVPIHAHDNWRLSLGVTRRF